MKRENKNRIINLNFRQKSAFCLFAEKGTANFNFDCRLSLLIMVKVLLKIRSGVLALYIKTYIFYLNRKKNKYDDVREVLVSKLILKILRYYNIFLLI
jgi:hypothetical protein